MSSAGQGEAAALREAVGGRYWHSSDGVNQIATALGLSKGRLYELIPPLPAGEDCPLCQGPLVFVNRSARDRGEGVCRGCTGAVSPEPLASVDSRREPVRVPTLEFPEERLKGGMEWRIPLGIGLVAGFFLGRYLR